ncbi:MAG: ABC transporter substrate-binding protein [Trueperaceae bacterium]|nr:ABC transporter substrate-binding protein [Trueperaceae bacterium]
MRRHLRYLGALALAAVAAGALGVATAQPVRELVIAQGIDHEGWDIHDHNTTAVEAIHVNVFDYLVFKDADGVIGPALATSWERIDDLSMRFLLREGVLWHDGESFTAEDVKFTLERVATDASLQEHNQYRQIREVEIVGPHEIIIHTHEPEPVLLSRLSRIGSSILAKHHIEAIGGWESISDHNPIGTGPFKVVEWRRDDRIIMEAFDDHWRGRPEWDRLVHRTIPEASTRVAELLTGGVHIATNIPPADKARVEGAANVRIEPWPTPRVMMFIMNTEGEGTSDLRVRTAIEYAIDSQLLIDALFDGLGAPVRGRASPGITAAPMEFYDTQLYDPERAVELLAEAGYGPGDLTIHIQGPAGRYPLDSEIIELTAVMLEAVGINTTLEILEWSAYQSRIWRQPNAVQHMALIGLGNSLGDAALTYTSIRCEDTYAMMSNWCNPEFDAIYAQALVELDGDRRAELFREVFTIVAEERVWVHLFQLENMAGVVNTIDWKPRPDEYLWMFDAKPVN